MAVAPPNPRPRVGDGPSTVVQGPDRIRAGLALTVVLAVLVLCAAFADGATQLPEESWVQLALAAVATAAAVAWSMGALRLRAAPWGWAGLGLLAAFAAWTAASIAWSVAPD